MICQLEIERSAVNGAQALDRSIDRFHFEILLRDKFPFQPPLITTRTKVLNHLCE
jgi:hypothetical protein